MPGATRAGCGPRSSALRGPGRSGTTRGATAAYVGESLFDLLTRTALSREAHFELRNRAREKGILFLSTPFDEESADLLDDLGVPAFKVGSGDLTNLPLLRHVAQKGKPMIVSTGMSRLGEVETALQTIEAEGNDRVVLLHCVSNYPAHPADVNLRAMATLATRVPSLPRPSTPSVMPSTS